VAATHWSAEGPLLPLSARHSWAKAPTVVAQSSKQASENECRRLSPQRTNKLVTALRHASWIDSHVHVPEWSYSKYTGSGRVCYVDLGEVFRHEGRPEFVLESGLETARSGP